MLKVTITGYCAEGKTTIASEIGALLESLGMNVTIHDIDLDDGPRNSEVHEGAVQAMKGRSVTIETIQLRKSNFNESQNPK